MLSSKPKIWKLLLLFMGIALLLVWNCAFLWKERRERQAEQSSSGAISSSDQM